MKKSIVWRICMTAAALTMAAALTGCGDSSAAEEPTANSAETTEAAESTDTTNADSDAADSESETTAAAADSEAEKTENAEQSDKTAAASDFGSDRATESSSGSPASSDSGLLEALINKIQTTDGAVTYHYSMEEADYTVSAKIVFYGKKYLIEEDMADYYSLKMCSDGTVFYMIDDDTKTYSAETDAASGEDLEQTDAPYISAASVGTQIGSGTGLFNGKECRCEDYEQIDEEAAEYAEYEDLEGDAETQQIRYYFDADGNLVGLEMLDGEAAGQQLNYTVTFSDTVEDALFVPPAGYTEISAEEMSEQMLMHMFGALYDDTDADLSE